jgi:hypothetical protein
MLVFRDAGEIYPGLSKPNTDRRPRFCCPGPKLVVEKGNTPVLSATDAHRLFKAIDSSKVQHVRIGMYLPCCVWSSGFARALLRIALEVDCESSTDVIARRSANESIVGLGTDIV